MKSSNQEPDATEKAAERVAQELNADVLLCNAEIATPLDRELLNRVRKRRRRENVLLILVTHGGDPDCAYRIARCLQTKYSRFYLFVTGHCKSAGTLIALGAHELIVGDEGELGPLDVQMSKQDSLMETQSGLTVNAALTALQSKAYLAFEEFFLQTEERSQGLITVKTAGDIATKLTVGLFAPLYAQVDPFFVGEAARAMQIADHYGRRLVDAGENMDMSDLQHLVAHYPSHGFVIDREEATSIFKSVREPTESESALATLLDAVAVVPITRGQQVLVFLSPEVEEVEVPEEEKAIEEPVRAPHHAAPTISVAELADLSWEDNNGGTGSSTRASAPRPPA